MLRDGDGGGGGGDGLCSPAGEEAAVDDGAGEQPTDVDATSGNRIQ